MRCSNIIICCSDYAHTRRKKRADNRVNDGWYLNPKRKHHSFYTEFRNESIDKMLWHSGFGRNYAKAAKWLFMTGISLFVIFAIINFLIMICRKV